MVMDGEMLGSKDPKETQHGGAWQRNTEGHPAGQADNYDKWHKNSKDGAVAWDETGDKGKYGGMKKEGKGADDGKMLTMGDVSKHLANNFGEEIEDANKYLCMAKIADSADDDRDCHYLLEIAKDEFTHAWFIYDFMERHDMPMPEDLKEKYHKLEKEMSEFF